MTTITINKDIKLSKTHFKDIGELQEELLLAQQEQFELSDEHKRILDEREKILDASEVKGRPWKEVLANIKR